MDDQTFSVSEIIGPTIQGEGQHAGRPCVFVRMAGCNMWTNPKARSVRCPWCDTPQLHNGTDMALSEIVNAVGKLVPDDSDNYGIVITGGEPLLQLTRDLVEALLEHSRVTWMDVETNGTIACDWLRDFLGVVFVSCSPKVSAIRIQPDWFKVVVPAMEYLLPKVEAASPGTPIYVQPCEPLDKEGKGYEDAKEANVKHAVDLCLAKGYYLSLQLHKALNLP